MVSDLIDECIKDAVAAYVDGYDKENPFEELLSMGELVDRLSIINFKLYKLKDDQVNNNSPEFLAWAAGEDVRLVKERARLKRCIDQKLELVIMRAIKTGDTGFNAEVKKYGTSY